ncbi:MAG TPA: DUF4389 domain-containing protein [Nitrosomonas sp.]|uniref:DUF4389 domain-containing protein n=1 Tax=Nitrosomonas sp. TaxID=42353 RepID=UPI000E9446D8|nr:DUF4389 domain-containing protein [Nitrosomonas sp.]GJL76257.1 MAG: hypothetical protein NMNS02_23630 [Nitrosomonas sp.]HBV21652.1 DUF4389 domain-containing protein [Nitrosomonas sp.]HNP25637.1 DUF4389 domain-containing protein [Nitrosomonas sp.]
MREEIKQSLQKNEILVRGLFMLFFIVIYSISKFLIVGIMLFQLAAVLLAEKPNEQILKFSQNLSIYIYQIVQFLSFNNEQRPFPFSKWPDGTTSSSVEVKSDQNE